MKESRPERGSPTAQEVSPRTRRLLIVDPAWRSRGEADRHFSDRLAGAFYGAGFEVFGLAADDHGADGAFGRLRRILPPEGDGNTAGAPVSGLGHPWIEFIDGWARAAWKNSRSGVLAKAAAAILWTSVRVLYRVEWVMALVAWRCARVLGVLAQQCRRWASAGARAFRRGYRCIALPFLQLLGSVTHFDLLTTSVAPSRAPDAAEADTADAELAKQIATLTAEDVLVLPSAELSHFEMLFQLLPYLGVSRPVPATLHVRFACSCPGLGSDHESGLMLAARLKSGSPIRTIVLHADTAEQCYALERGLSLRVHECGSDHDPATLLRRFAPAPLSVSPTAHDPLDVPPSLVVNRFGPVALLISALWGRTGSSTVFDAQTRYLLKRGFVVARILVDHYPTWGDDRAARVNRLLAENFENLRPHLHLVAERDHSFRHLSKLYATAAFRESSPVGRMGMLLAGARVDRPAVAAWCADRTVLTIVNHLPHVAFAERLASAPIVLETHDIFAKLLTLHGIPDFVPKGPDGDRRREADEIRVWGRVAACVNLSPDDHAVVSPVVPCSALARPYVHRIPRSVRSWPEVLAANRLPAELRNAPPFDIMLWGDWHEGNAAGIRWFLEQVADRHACLQEASILLVGRVAQALPARLLQRQRLYAVGFVDCIDDFFARSTVLVIPDPPGSTGTSIKAIDAFARGCCFASTAAGMRGVTLGDTGLAPSNDPAALALDIVGLLRSRDARRSRAAAALRLYELNFSKAAYSEAWDAILHALLPGLPIPATAVSRTSPISAWAAASAPAQVLRSPHS
jgi:Glycosyl transferases group 1